MFSRIKIAMIGVTSGLITFMPNCMMSDSGTPSAEWGATIGVSASGAYVVGGLIGGWFKKPAFLLPGLALQIGAFVIPPCLVHYGLIENDQTYWTRFHAERCYRKAERERDLEVLHKINNGFSSPNSINPEKTFF